MGIRLFHSAQLQPYYIDLDKGQSTGHVTATVLTVTRKREFIFIKLPQSIREHRRFDNREQ